MAAWTALLFFLLALPYLYLVFENENFPWQLIVAILLLPALSTFSLLTQKKEKEKSLFWEFYAQVYDMLLKFRPYKKLIKEVADEVSSIKGSGKILDFGCGTGNISVELEKNGNYEITAADSSRHMLRRLRGKLGKVRGRHSFLRIDLEKDLLTINDRFDAIVINNVLYTMETPEATLRSAVSLLKPDGAIIISEPLVGSSIWSLIKKHFKETSFFQAIWEALIFSIPGILLLIYNALISLRAEQKRMHFFQATEISLILKNLGLNVLSEKTVYAEQNIFVKAQKK